MVLNSAPVLDSIGVPSTLAEGEQAWGAFQVSDLDGDMLSYTTTGLPPGLTMEGTTTGMGVLMGSTDYNLLDGGSAVYTPTLTISDGNGGVVTHTFTLTLFDWNRLADPIIVSSMEGEPVGLFTQGVGGSNEPIMGVTYDATGLPLGLSIDSSTGTISGTLSYTNATAGGSTTFTVQVTLTDGNGATDERAFDWVVTNQPILMGPTTQQNAEGDMVWLSWAPMPYGLSFGATNLPQGLGMDTSGNVSGTVGYGNANGGGAGVFNAVIEAWQDGLLVETLSVEWTVTDTNRLAEMADQSDIEGWEVELQTQATDLIGNALTYSAVGLPVGLSIDPNTGLISGELAGPDSLDPVEVTVSVTGGGGTDERTFEWEVIPGLSAEPMADQFSTVGDSVSLSPVVEIGGTLTLTYSATGLPAGLSISTATGEITGTATTVGSYTVEVLAECGDYGTTLTFAWEVVPVTQDDVVEVGVGEETSLIVALFTPSDLGTVASEYTATINWGDGQTSVGFVTQEDGEFVVSGTHAYAVAGPYAVEVALTHLGVSVVVGLLPEWLSLTSVFVAPVPPSNLLTSSDVRLGRLALSTKIREIITTQRVLSSNEMKVAFAIFTSRTDGTQELARTLLTGRYRNADGLDSPATLTSMSNFLRTALQPDLRINPSEKVTAAVDDLIEKLGDDAFAVREAALATLKMKYRGLANRQMYSLLDLDDADLRDKARQFLDTTVMPDAAERIVFIDFVYYNFQSASARTILNSMQSYHVYSPTVRQHFELRRGQVNNEP